VLTIIAIEEQRIVVILRTVIIISFPPHYARIYLIPIEGRGEVLLLLLISPGS